MLSHMVVKLVNEDLSEVPRLRVVLSHMVVKLSRGAIGLAMQFESSVISYGSQTTASHDAGLCRFESSVISYGSQTTIHKLRQTT